MCPVLGNAQIFFPVLGDAQIFFPVLGNAPQKRLPSSGERQIFFPVLGNAKFFGPVLGTAKFFGPVLGTAKFFGPVMEAHFLRPVLERPDTLRSRRPSNPSIRHPSDFAPVVCDPVAEVVA